MSNPRLGLPMTEMPLPEILKPAGYVCGAIGKWHLGYAPNLLPNARGFDEFFGFWVLSPITSMQDVLRDDDAFGRARIFDRCVYSGSSSPLSFAMRRNLFFSIWPIMLSHSPYTGLLEAYLDRVPNISDPGRRTYAAMVVALDDGVGPVLQTLQAQTFWTIP